MRNIAIVISVFIIILGGVLYLKNLNTPKQEKTSEQAQNISKESSESSQESKILAGKSSPFLEFNKVDYEKALSENKIIFLDFYANWCPICRGEAPLIVSGFNALATDKIIGFRVNFKDSDTDSDEISLAKEFNIPYQHTKVILKEGKEFSRSADSWTKEDFDREINKALQ